MDLEVDYIEYVIEFSLALLAASATYFFDPYRPLSYGVLLLIPLLFGYTTYISREGFSYSSLLALIALMFVPLNYLVASIAVFIAVGNILISLFSGGHRFKEFYSSTTIPLLITGIILGSGFFLLATTSPEFGDQLRGATADFMGEQVSTVVNEAGMIEAQKDAQKAVIEQTSTATVTATQAYVIENTSLSTQDNLEVIDTFESARQDIPERITGRAAENMEGTSIDLKERVSVLLDNNLRGKVLLALIPLTALGLYSLQPLVGLLTALSALAFRSYGGKD